MTTLSDREFAHGGFVWEMTDRIHDGDDWIMTARRVRELESDTLETVGPAGLTLRIVVDSDPQSTLQITRRGELGRDDADALKLKTEIDRRLEADDWTAWAEITVVAAFGDHRGSASLGGVIFGKNDDLAAVARSRVSSHGMQSEALGELVAELEADGMKLDHSGVGDDVTDTPVEICEG